MGMDMFGFVEVKAPGGFQWRAVVDAGRLLDRDSWVFNCLFGMGRVSVYEPLFFARGWPEDCSRDARELDDSNSAGRSWFTLAELEAVDLDEPAARFVVDVWETSPDGVEKLADTTTVNPLAPPHAARLEEEHELRFENRRYHLRYPTRREALGGFGLVRDLMERLGQEFGPENVRLVVGFDY